MAASSEDFLAQALLSLKDSTDQPINNYFMGSTLKDVDQRMKVENNSSMYHHNPPVLLEPSLLHTSNNDIDSFQKLQLKSLMNTKDKSFFNKKTPSTNIHSLLSTTTSCSVTNQYVSSQVNNLPSIDTNSFTMTFSNNHQQKGMKSNSTSTAWDLACTYTGVGISKPRKMMINRWYAESLTSPTKSPLDSLQEQFPQNELKEKKEEVDSPLTSTDSGDDAEEEYTQPSDSLDDEDDDETVSSCSSSEEVKKPKKQTSPKQVKKKQTTSTAPVIRKKKKHTTKGQFNTGWWSDDEHQRFLKGLKECGHNWKMISTKYVKTRGRRQCASHAQKWYLSIRYAEEREQMEKL